MNLKELQNKLEKESIIFWNKHDYQKAIITLNKLRTFWGDDFSLYTNENLLKPDNLLISYLGRNSLNFNDLNYNIITYEFLINDLADYWNKQARLFRDNQKRLDAIGTSDLFSKIVKGITGTLDFISNPIILLAILTISFVYLIKK